MEEGINWFGGPFVFNGYERWQLWFYNPNKAAVLLVELALLGLVMVFAKRRCASALGCTVFILPSLAMVLTFSRGGLVAWLASVLIVLWHRIRESGWSRRMIIVLGSMFLVLVVSVNSGLSRRMTDGFSGDDRSVTNRFDVWGKVPQMMHDSPWGWGFGNSGAAYMNWYQPLDRLERYRTLVNSHLTWFVEMGWIGTFVWVVAWVTLLWFGIFIGFKFRRWTCAAQLLCLAISGGFSSVLESTWLWIIPIALVLYEVTMFRNEMLHCFRRCAIWGVGCGVGLVALMFVGVKISCTESRILKTVGCVEYRGENRICWVVVDNDALGGVNYPRILRECAARCRLVTFRFIKDVGDLPDGAEVVVFCGKAESCGRRGVKRTMWLSPSVNAPVAPGDTIIIGEFSAGAWKWGELGAIEISGAGDYISSWPCELSLQIL